MTWLILASLATVAGVILLGHVRLLDRQRDVEAVYRQVVSLMAQRAALPEGEARSRLEPRLATLRDLHARELARYLRTPGARLNRWRSRSLPPLPKSTQLAESQAKTRLSGSRRDA